MAKKTVKELKEEIKDELMENVVTKDELEEFKNEAEELKETSSDSALAEELIKEIEKQRKNAPVSENKEEINECGNCGAKFKGRPEKCPSCGQKIVGWE
ncbi:MAG: hypothetical protein ACOC44_18295 [Promethearchaeia archaeon]